MSLTILRLPAVLRRKGDSRSSTYAQIKAGTFPSPIKLGPRMAGWPDFEVDVIIEARVAGKSDDEIRELVSRLLEARKNIGGTTVTEA